MGLIKSLIVFLIKLGVVSAIATFGFLFAMGFADGPRGIVPGGAFQTGELVEGEPDWSFLKDRREVEFQLLNPVGSRTAWIAEHDGRIFIPSGYMNSTLGKIWKHWPMDAERDGRVILRVDGRLYPRHMVRIMNDPALDDVLNELNRKYFGGGRVADDIVERGDLWVFELVPPRE
jgi:hypothetical protein